MFKKWDFLFIESWISCLEIRIPCLESKISSLRRAGSCLWRAGFLFCLGQDFLLLEGISVNGEKGFLYFRAGFLVRLSFFRRI